NIFLEFFSMRIKQRVCVTFGVSILTLLGFAGLVFTPGCKTRETSSNVASYAQSQALTPKTTHEFDRLQTSLYEVSENLSEYFAHEIFPSAFEGNRPTNIGIPIQMETYSFGKDLRNSVFTSTYVCGKVDKDSLKIIGYPKSDQHGHRPICSDLPDSYYDQSWQFTYNGRTDRSGVSGLLRILPFLSKSELIAAERERLFRKETFSSMSRRVGRRDQKDASNRDFFIDDIISDKQLDSLGVDPSLPREKRLDSVSADQRKKLLDQAISDRVSTNSAVPGVLFGGIDPEGKRVAVEQQPSAEHWNITLFREIRN
ncbi:MAG: hypothetical protein NT027_00480, partial [Proteobacteria bacterium]|nr:hypothetical protein [Pseudomonadota bacterium]